MDLTAFVENRVSFVRLLPRLDIMNDITFLAKKIHKYAAMACLLTDDGLAECNGC